MATFTSCPQPAHPPLSRQHAASGVASRCQLPVTEHQKQPKTVFDLLYDQYLPFRLYADFMLGSSTSELAKRFGLSEHWVSERIQAVRWCVEKQVRVNLLAQAV